jgi:hypothetical protein
VQRSKIDKAPAKSGNLVIGAVHQHHFRFVVGLAERRGNGVVVGLPERGDGVADPQVGVVVTEYAFHALDLEAQLQFGFEGIEPEIRLGKRLLERGVVGRIGVLDRQEIIRAMRPEQEAPCPASSSSSSDATALTQTRSGGSARHDR